LLLSDFDWVPDPDPDPDPPTIATVTADDDDCMGVSELSFVSTLYRVCGWLLFRGTNLDPFNVDGEVEEGDEGKDEEEEEEEEEEEGVSLE
jgi:hypothetical protein